MSLLGLVHGQARRMACNLSHKIDIKVKVTTRIGDYALLRLKMVKIQKCFLALDRKYLSPLYIEERGIDIYGIRNC